MDDADSHVAWLETKLAARERTIAALMRRVQSDQAHGGSAFVFLEQNVVLEQGIAKRTLELAAQKLALEEALSELRTTHAKLVQAQKLEAIGHLAAGIAHEINTPAQYVNNNTVFLQRAFAQLLAVVDSCLAVVHAAGSGPVPVELIAEADVVVRNARVDYLRHQVPRALEQSLDGLRRVTTIVSAMKDFSHPSAGEKQLVNLADAVQTTLTVARNEWKYVAEVETDFPEDVPSVPCLRDEFNQVVLNLVVNAAQAIGEANNDGADGLGKIRISLRREDDFVTLRIADTGRGIPEGIQRRIFDPFFTTKPVGKGTGQGLAIAYSVVVDKHRGSIRFESELGKGTTFIVSIPIVDDGQRRPKLP